MATMISTPMATTVAEYINMKLILLLDEDRTWRMSGRLANLIMPHILFDEEIEAYAPFFGGGWHPCNPDKTYELGLVFTEEVYWQLPNGEYRHEPSYWEGKIYFCRAE